MRLDAAVSRECRSRAGNLALGSATQEKTRQAKLRVKSQIFSSDIDHHVSVQYTPFIGDEKRDYVEYTSEARSQRPVAPSRRRRDSWPSHDAVGRFFLDFEHRAGS